MDKLLIIDIMLNSALITILLFGAYLVLKQLHPSKIKIIFLVFAVVRSILFFMMLMDQVARANSGEGEASPLNYYSIVYSVISHPFLIFLFYNLIFSLKTSAKIVAIHIAIFLSIFGAIWICDYYSPESRFDNFSSIEGAYSNIESPLMILKICMLFVQLTFSLIVFVVVSKLVPIYQNYIEKNESNSAYNRLWVREICYITLILTIMHIVNILFVTYTTSFIYYTVVSLAFVRMIELFLRQRTVDYFEDLYSKIGVKWSFKKMWYVDEVVYSNPLEKSLKMFEEINRWIIKDKPFSNPDFSFKDVSKQFDGMSYRDLCAILDEANGLTFQSYIRECRISEAISLMEPSASGGNDYTLKEIAFMVGFESSSSFSRSFKAVKNVSATEWRKRK